VGLKEIAGVFSRRFVVGFFIPAFFVILALTQLVDHRALPNVYNAAKGGSQVLIVGGFAVLVGLLLSGLHYSLLRFLEGYWLIRPRLPGGPENPRHGLAGLLRRAHGWTLEQGDVAASAIG
jgi:hypothetical protein